MKTVHDQRFEDPKADARGIARRADDGHGSRPEEGTQRGRREQPVQQFRVRHAGFGRED